MRSIMPLMPPQFYKTYTVRSPLPTHWRPAKCAEYECDEWVHGQVLTIDTNTELGQRQFHYLTHDRSRKFSKQLVGNGLWKFIYGPGNECFRSGDHRVPIGRPPYLLVSEGDWRGNPRGTPVYRHRSMDNWVEDFALHQQRLADAIKEG